MSGLWQGAGAAASGACQACSNLACAATAYPNPAAARHSPASRPLLPPRCPAVTGGMTVGAGVSGAAVASTAGGARVSSKPASLVVLGDMTVGGTGPGEQSTLTVNGRAAVNGAGAAAPALQVKGAAAVGDGLCECEDPPTGWLLAAVEEGCWAPLDATGLHGWLWPFHIAHHRLNLPRPPPAAARNLTTSGPAKCECGAGRTPRGGHRLLLYQPCCRSLQAARALN